MCSKTHRHGGLKRDPLSLIQLSSLKVEGPYPIKNNRKSTTAINLKLWLLQFLIFREQLVVCKNMQRFLFETKQNKQLKKISLQNWRFHLRIAYISQPQPWETWILKIFALAWQDILLYFDGLLLPPGKTCHGESGVGARKLTSPKETHQRFWHFLHNSRSSFHAISAPK